jgi:hypothetical protein
LEKSGKLDRPEAVREALAAAYGTFPLTIAIDRLSDTL